MFIAIVPAYNEEKNIGSVVRSLFAHVDKVVVVDDASQDKTAVLATEAGAIVLQHKINLGQGAALQTGQDYALQAGADFVLHFDGDGQFDVADIGPAWQKLKETGADILFGSRFLDKRSQIPWLKRYLLFPLARIFNRWLGVSLSDVHNGFRILRRRVLQSLKIEQPRMAHASEIPAKVKKLGLKQIEFPVKVVYREYGQGAWGGMSIIKDLFFSKFLK